MIRKTLQTTKAATFSVDIPLPEADGFPAPAGTGFFISPDGWFLTAAHVVMDRANPGMPRADLDKAWLTKEHALGAPGAMCQWPRLEWVDPSVDIALLKLDFDKNAEKDFLKGKPGFPAIRVSSRTLEDGEPVYSFGYPLSKFGFVKSGGGIEIGPDFKVAHVAKSPRTTSAIVAGQIEESRMIATSHDPKVYVLDKALNYGNSGGPIVASETGYVHALCSRFQPVQIPQNHIRGGDGKPLVVMIPSLYGVVSSLANVSVLTELERRGIEVAAE